MKRMPIRGVATSILALGLAVSAGTASAQTYFDTGRYQDGRYGAEPYDSRSYGTQPTYAYARVLSVRPVMDGGYRGYPASSQRCYQRSDTYAGRDDYYRNDGGYRNDGYYGRDGGYRDAGDIYGNGYGGSSTGRTVATVLGGIVGAAIGSQVGGGSARYATSAIGSMVGGIAGQKVYENAVRNRSPRSGTVTVCDPVPDDRYYDTYGTGGAGANAYDVTYEYGGREYTARTRYHPGDRIRVLVDVRPE
jgi:hypothetical protein